VSFGAYYRMLALSSPVIWGATTNFSRFDLLEVAATSEDFGARDATVLADYCMELMLG
jgi:hypothetical protein